MFLEEVSLMASTDNIDSRSGLVHLMTLHSAKGLEFDTVFIAGMEEGLFPHSRSLLGRTGDRGRTKTVLCGNNTGEKKSLSSLGGGEKYFRLRENQCSFEIFG